jgi:hypothetical protein
MLESLAGAAFRLDGEAPPPDALLRLSAFRPSAFGVTPFGLNALRLCA